MTRPLTFLTVLFLLFPVLAGSPAEAQRRGFGGFGGGRRTFSNPSFSRPTFPRPPAPRPPRVSPPPPTSVPPSGGFGSGRATGVAGAPKAPPAPPAVAPSGGFGGGEARGVAGANARNPVSSRPPDAAAPPGPTGRPRSGFVTSAPRPPAAAASARPAFRETRPVRGSPNVYVYDRRPSWVILPFWWHPPIYTPYGTMVTPGGTNVLGILMTLIVVGVIGAVVFSLLRRGRGGEHD